MIVGELIILIVASSVAISFAILIGFVFGLVAMLEYNMHCDKNIDLKEYQMCLVGWVIMGMLFAIAYIISQIWYIEI